MMMMALKMTRAVPKWAAKRRPNSNGSNGCRRRLIIRTGRADGLSGEPISHIGHCARDRLCDKGCVRSGALVSKALCAIPPTETTASAKRTPKRTIQEE